MESIEIAGVLGGVESNAEFLRSEEIKAEYLASGCQATDVDDAVCKLMAECSSLFENDRYAWSFLMEEAHEELENTNELPVLTSGLLVKTIGGETDTDENGENRVTPPGAVGHLVHENLPGQWAVHFGDAAVYIDAQELLDPNQYAFMQ